MSPFEYVLPMVSILVGLAIGDLSLSLHRLECRCATPPLDFRDFEAARATPSTALGILAALSWHLHGGGCFGTTGKRGDVPLDPATA